MRGIVYTGEAVEVITDLEVVAPGPGEVHVRPVAAGVCHSDVSVIDGTIPYPTPVVLGHEGAGVVETVGDGVTTIEPGDHVVVSTLANCGHCRYCNTGRPTWCRESIGNIRQPFTVGGEPAFDFAASSAFAELTVVREIQAVKIDDDVPLESACLIACGVLTGVGAVLNRARVQPGDTAAVFGAGGVGLNVIQGLRIANASRIIAIDTMPQKEATARDFGATDFVNPNDVDDVNAAVRDLIGEPAGLFASGGVTWAFECVGRPELLDTAIESLDWGGTAVAVGVPGPDARLNARITHFTQIDRGVIGTRYGSARPQHDIPLLVDLYKAGDLKLDELVSATYPLEDFSKVLEDMEAGKLARGVLTF